MTTHKLHTFIAPFITVILALASISGHAQTELQPPSPVAVRYDGWIPQGGGFNPQRCFVELRFGVSDPGVKFKGLVSYYPVNAAAYERRAAHELSGNQWTVIPYPTQVAFERRLGDSSLNFTFRSGNRSDSAAFWQSIFAVEFTETTVVNGQERQTAIGDCQVSQVTWL
mgnify:CR=1 FL=1